MSKNRRNRESGFRYQRVYLAHADSSDSEDDLDRVLGPSTTKGKKEPKGKKCGCCLAICGFLLALGTLVLVIGQLSH